MVAYDIRERLKAERAGVVLVGTPGGQLDVGDCLINYGIVAEGEAGPLVDDGSGGEVGVPGEPAETVEVGLREMVSQPVVVETYVGDTYKTAGVVAFERDFTGLPGNISKSSASFHIGTRKTV